MFKMFLWSTADGDEHYKLTISVFAIERRGDLNRNLMAVKVSLYFSRIIMIENKKPQRSLLLLIISP